VTKSETFGGEATGSANKQTADSLGSTIEIETESGLKIKIKVSSDLHAKYALFPGVGILRRGANFDFHQVMQLVAQGEGKRIETRTTDGRLVEFVEVNLGGGQNRLSNAFDVKKNNHGLLGQASTSLTALRDAGLGMHEVKRDFAAEFEKGMAKIEGFLILADGTIAAIEGVILVQAGASVYGAVLAARGADKFIAG
jgi:hypothetical protein